MTSTRSQQEKKLLAHRDQAAKLSESQASIMNKAADGTNHSMDFHHYSEPEDSDPDSQNTKVENSRYVKAYSNSDEFKASIRSVKSRLAQIPSPATPEELRVYETRIRMSLQRSVELAPLLIPIDDTTPSYLRRASRSCGELIRSQLHDTEYLFDEWPCYTHDLLLAIHRNSSSPLDNPGSVAPSSLQFPDRSKHESMRTYIDRVENHVITFCPDVDTAQDLVHYFAGLMWYTNAWIFPVPARTIRFTAEMANFHTMFDVFRWFALFPGFRDPLISPNDPRRSNTTNFGVQGSKNRSSHPNHRSHYKGNYHSQKPNFESKRGINNNRSNNSKSSQSSNKVMNNNKINENTQRRGIHVENNSQKPNFESKGRINNNRSNKGRINNNRPNNSSPHTKL